MTSYIALAIAATLCTVSGAGSQTVTREFNGHWAGGIEVGQQWQFVQIAVMDDSGTFRAPLNGVSTRLAALRADGQHVYWEVAAGATFAFDGTRMGDSITGTVTGGGTQGRFRLVRVRQLPAVTLASYAGLYRLRNGNALMIDVLPDVPNAIMVTNVGTGSTRAFLPRSDTSFVAGTSMFGVPPVVQSLSFRRTGAGALTALLRTAPHDAGESATAVALRREDVTFDNGSVRLAGTLLLPPPGQRLVAAVVFTHGGGPAVRETFWGLAYLLASRGIAVLTYDKRGVGQSSGSWRDASFDELASDAVTGARYLQSRGDIDSSSIGFWGLSQGGWIAPLAASQFARAAFAIALSGGGLSPALQELYDTEYELGMAGFSKQAIDSALDFQRTRDKYTVAGEGWSEYALRLEQARTARWFRYPGTDTWGPAAANDPYWTNVRRYYFYDPSPALRTLNAPVLAMFGELDTPVAARLNATRMAALLDSAGHRHSTVALVPQARHNLMETSASNPREFARLNGFPPGLFTRMVDWILLVVGTK
jgi:pimeloyl-ACP methyl ester carboxylesterase